MKITGGSVTVEMEMVEAKTLLKILGGLTTDHCEKILQMTEDEIKTSDDLFQSLDDYFKEVL